MIIPPWVYAAGALMVATIGFAAGWEVRTWKADSDELAAVEKAEQRGRELQQLADYQAGRYEEQRHEADVAARARDTEIRTIYRTEQIEVPAECEPPPAVLRVLDDAIRDANAQAAGQPLPAVPADPGEAEPVR